jgi:glycosyltransferase involved in cell wall biosynthesis
MGASGRVADALEAAAVRASTMVTSTSQLLLDALGRWGGLGRGRARVIPPAMDVARWAPATFPETTGQVVVFAGRLEARKGVDTMIEAAGRLMGDVPGLSVVLLGRQGDGSWLRRLVGEAAAPCSFPGHVTQDGLAGARVVAAPSRFDTGPLTGLEAMAAGRPLVCTNRTGIAELLGDSGAGAVVPADDPQALADALRPYLLDPAAAGMAGRSARRLVEERCRAEVVLAERENVYTEAIVTARRRSPPP